MKPYTIIKNGQSEILQSGDLDLYQYNAYIGNHSIQTSTRNSYWYINNNEVISQTGTGKHIDSKLVCVEIFGYTPEKRTSTFSKLTDLPYINGCSTKQLINPNRIGDPTWQLLYIPNHTSEQAHHIHSTARIVYVLKGKGQSHIGQGIENLISFDLEAGDVLVLDKMVPHHFSTSDDSLIVLPLHIFSSTEQEYNHPMFNGTYRT
jgi:hypothetical protein